MYGNVIFNNLRFKKNLWSGSNAWTMVEVYNSLPEAERKRIESIEMLDEQELLTQLLEHYCISVAWNGTLFESLTIANIQNTEEPIINL